MKTKVDWLIPVCSMVVLSFGVAFLTLTPTTEDRSGGFSVSFAEAMEMERLKDRCVQHCNQWFAEDGAIESVTPDGTWLSSRKPNGQIIYTALRTGVMEHLGGYLFIMAGRSKIEVTQNTDVVVAGVNIRLGIADEQGAMVWFGRTTPGPGKLKIDTFGIQN